MDPQQPCTLAGHQPGHMWLWDAMSSLSQDISHYVCTMSDSTNVQLGSGHFADTFWSVTLVWWFDKLFDLGGSHEVTEPCPHMWAHWDGRQWWCSTIHTEILLLYFSLWQEKPKFHCTWFNSVVALKPSTPSVFLSSLCSLRMTKTINVLRVLHLLQVTWKAMGMWRN